MENYRESLKKYFSHIEICGEELPEIYYKEIYLILIFFKEGYDIDIFDKLKTIRICKIEDVLRNGKPEPCLGRYRIGSGIVEINSDYFGLNAIEEKKKLVLKDDKFRYVLSHELDHYCFERKNLLEKVREHYHNNKEYYDSKYQYLRNDLNEDTWLKSINTIEFIQFIKKHIDYFIDNYKEENNGK